MLMFVTYLKQISDFEKIQQPNDLLCQTNPQLAVDNYVNLRKYALEALKNIQRGNFISAEQVNKREQLTEAINTLMKLPENLTSVEKSRYAERIYRSQEEKCIK